MGNQNNRSKKRKEECDDDEHESTERKSVRSLKNFPSNAPTPPQHGTDSPGVVCRHCGKECESLNQLHRHLKEEHDEHGERVRSPSPQRVAQPRSRTPEGHSERAASSPSKPQQPAQLPAQRATPIRRGRSVSIAGTPFREKAKELIQQRESQPAESKPKRQENPKISDIVPGDKMYDKPIDSVFCQSFFYLFFCKDNTSFAYDSI